MKRALRKAVREYYDWQGDREVHPVGFVKNRDDVEMLLVRVTDAQGAEISCLMSCQNWADGHWDVTEMWNADRDREEELVERYRQSGLENPMEEE